jgi:hypothetical protein
MYKSYYKSKYLLLSEFEKLIFQNKINISNENLELVNKFTGLGVFFDYVRYVTGKKHKFGGSYFDKTNKVFETKDAIFVKFSSREQSGIVSWTPAGSEYPYNGNLFTRFIVWPNEKDSIKFSLTYNQLMKIRGIYMNEQSFISKNRLAGTNKQPKDNFNFIINFDNGWSGFTLTPEVIIKEMWIVIWKSGVNNDFVKKFNGIK